MADVRVICPTCNAELAIGEEHIGKEVECGSCLGAFVAEDPKTKKKPYKMRRTEREDDDDDDERPKKKRRRRRDDDDDYDYSPPSASGDGSSTLGVLSLVFGLISFPLMCCCYLNVPASLAGIACGAIGLAKPASRSLSIAGIACSVISLVIFGGMFAIGMGAQAVNFGKFGR